MTQLLIQSSDTPVSRKVRLALQVNVLPALAVVRTPFLLCHLPWFGRDSQPGCVLETPGPEVPSRWAPPPAQVMVYSAPGEVRGSVMETVSRWILMLYSALSSCQRIIPRFLVCLFSFNLRSSLIVFPSFGLCSPSDSIQIVNEHSFPSFSVYAHICKPFRSASYNLHCTAVCFSLDFLLCL